MNKVVVTAFDAADAVSKLAVVEAAIPTPAANQVLVHMRARPVNPADTFSIMVRGAKTFCADVVFLRRLCRESTDIFGKPPSYSHRICAHVRP